MKNRKIDKVINVRDVLEGGGDNTYDSFKEKLESVQTFPGSYIFKFIVNDDKEKIEQLKALFPAEEFVYQSSKTGKYISITVSKQVANADEVVAIYKKAGEIKGVMLL